MPGNSTDFQNRYHVLQQQFYADLPTRLAHILTASHHWLAAEAPPPVAEGEFLILVHNLAGSAGSFGFPEISTLCQRIEEAIRKNDPASKQAIRSLLNQLQTIIQ